LSQEAVTSYAERELAQIDGLELDEDEDERERLRERKKRPRRASVDYDMMCGPRVREEYDASYLVSAAVLCGPD
jgi:hypothetical protein